MKTIKKLIALIAAMTTLVTATAALAEDYGSGAVGSGETYTLEQMLTYALQDEYMASAEYQALIEKFGAQPFENILGAEAQHVSELMSLFAAYNVTAPENTAADRVQLPETVEEAYAAGVQAEVSNIAMYQEFLKQDIPDDVRQVFEALMNASENHLEAFERNAERQTASPRRSSGEQPGRYGASSDDTADDTADSATDSAAGAGNGLRDGSGAGTGNGNGNGLRDGSGAGTGNGTGNGRGGRNGG